MKYSLINACCDLGVSVDGANLGAKAITKFYKDKYKVYDIEEDKIEKSHDVNDLAKNLKYVNKFNEKLYNNNLKVLNDGYFPITIGGDHVIAISSSLASIKYHNNLGMIWIDSHGDFNNFKTTVTGNLHGLPFAALTNFHDTQLLSEFHDHPYYNFKNSVLVGARDVDDGELINLKEAGITIFTTEDIRKYGVKYIMDKAYEIALNNTNGIHVSYDVDVIDPIIAPGVSIKASDGINLNEAYDIMRYVAENKNVVKSLDIVEYNPLKDIDNKTLKICCKLLDIFIEKNDD